MVLRLNLGQPPWPLVDIPDGTPRHGQMGYDTMEDGITSSEDRGAGGPDPR